MGGVLLVRGCIGLTGCRWCKNDGLSVVGVWKREHCGLGAVGVGHISRQRRIHSTAWGNAPSLMITEHFRALKGRSPFSAGTTVRILNPTHISRRILHDGAAWD
jgi:hypothetical protein